MTHIGKKRSVPAGKLGFPTGALYWLFLLAFISHLCHEVAHGLRRLVLLLEGGVGASPEVIEDKYGRNRSLVPDCL